MIQRIGACANCGYFDGFIPSWKNAELEMIKATWLIELDPYLVESLLEYLVVTVEHFDGDWVYWFASRVKNHLTVYRTPISIKKVGFGKQERVGKTNQ